MKRSTVFSVLFLCMVFLAYAGTYDKTQLYSFGKLRTFSGLALQTVAFPLGGIGTGSVSLRGTGQLSDWEIFNRPDKGGSLDYTFFAIWAQPAGQVAQARILERTPLPPFAVSGHGLSQRRMYGLPRFQEAVFCGEYPFGRIEFQDKNFPVQVALEAWSPYVPLNPDDSSLPMAVFFWKIKNPGNVPVNVSICATLNNQIGDKYSPVSGKKPGLGGNLNQFIEDSAMRGLLLTAPKIDSHDPNYGSMALTTAWPEVEVQTRWYRGGWWDQCHVFWDDFSADGRLLQVRDGQPSAKDTGDMASLLLPAEIAAHDSVLLPFVLTWHFPNRENYWNGENEVRGKIMENFTARYQDAWDVARYSHRHLARLEKETRMFHDAVYSTTLPDYVVDALSSQAAILKTNVVMRLRDGSFFGFEGNSNNDGCCPLNCTHVWNYEQTLAFLFPSLERSMRETDFLHNTLANGYMTFRTLLPLGDYWWHFKPCADGQMGCIIRAYREWKMSGDNEWLKKLWPNIKLALEFAWKGNNNPASGCEWTTEQIRMAWDPNKDGVMEAEQHNTYDIEFYGPNTMTGSLYLGALRAAMEMAEAMGEKDKVREYAKVFTSGRNLYDATLWNGKYYIQDMYVLEGLKVPDFLASPDSKKCAPGCACKTTPGEKKPALDKSGVTPKYQYGQGCLSDQLLGQYLSHVAGLGYVLPREHVRLASKSIFAANFKNPLADYANVQRVYALHDEAGLLLCSWPDGGRPALPFVYSDEVWTGIEYQVAAELIYDGWLDEGLSIVKAVRDRYNGERRNPWDEEECGHHYARAMASWALLPALSGFKYDGVNGEIAFHPVMHKEDFFCFWSSGSGWGVFKQTINSAEITVLYGKLGLKKIELDDAFGNNKVFLSETAVAAKSEKAKEGRVTYQLATRVDVAAGQSLRIR